MNEISAEIHKFSCENVYGDAFSLYTFFRHVLRLSGDISNQQLREKVANYIFQHEDMHYNALCGLPNGATIEQCRNQIKNSNMQIIDLELQALAMLYKKTICLIYKRKNVKDVEVSICLYGLNMLFDTKCVFIFYTNPWKKIIIFNFNDSIVEALRKFIEKDLKYQGHIQFDCYDDIDVNKAIYPIEGSVESAYVSNLIVENDNKNSSQDQTLTSDKIFNETLHDIAPASIDNCQSIEDYCSQVRNNLKGGEVEFLALTRLYYDKRIKFPDQIEILSETNVDTTSITDYVKYDEFKDVKHTHEFHIAISFWKQKPDEKNFYHYGDIQYLNNLHLYLVK
ncbi:unnamed protein product [Rotaria sordida]|uniref:Uncharacterized protein n=1 Tax=Rotaria sordida TaxID=392033 RepID=A0A819C5L1_9BILA|nr:unnamed protein product [Rotaria sordida]